MVILGSFVGGFRNLNSSSGKDPSTIDVSLLILIDSVTFPVGKSCPVRPLPQKERHTALSPRVQKSFAHDSGFGLWFREMLKHMHLSPQVVQIICYLLFRVRHSIHCPAKRSLHWGVYIIWAPDEQTHVLADPRLAVTLLGDETHFFFFMRNWHKYLENMRGANPSVGLSEERWW